MGIWERLRERAASIVPTPDDDARDDVAAAAPQAPGNSDGHERGGRGWADAVRIDVGWAELDAALVDPTVLDPTVLDPTVLDPTVLDDLATRIAGASVSAREVHVGVLATATASHRWADRATAEAYGAALPALRRALEKRGVSVDLWLTLRPWHTATADAAAQSARAIPDLVARTHHVALGHGLASRALRAEEARVGIVLDLAVHLPADENRGADLDAVHAADVVRNHLVVGPVLEGALPRDVVADPDLDVSAIRPGDLALTRARLDVLGLTPPLTSVLEGVPGAGTVLGAAARAMVATPDVAAEALFDQLRAFDVAHEGTPLLVDLAGAPAELLAGYEAAIAQAVGDDIPVAAVARDRDGDVRVEAVATADVGTTDDGAGR